MTLVAALLITPSPSPLQAASSPPQSGWVKIAHQQYDTQSPTVTIWEKDGERVICIDPGPASCAAYGGDVDQFRADAARETAQRAAQRKLEADRQQARQAEFQQRMKDHGVELLKNGWTEIARCHDGHTWSYVLQKGSERRRCNGINALGGPTERAFVAFTGDLERFKAAAKGPGNCWDAFK